MLPSYPPAHRLVMIKNTSVLQNPYELYEERTRYESGKRFLHFIQAGDREWCNQVVQEYQIPWSQVYID